MYKTYNSRLQRDLMEIFVGECYVTNKREIVTTLLGSCISVCLIDEINSVYGMNHFLLPGLKDRSNKESARFGTNNMELLINEMIKLGSTTKSMKAKVFGGAKVLKTVSDTITVNQDNIDFVHKFLYIENIEIVAEDVGGVSGRKIYFDTKDGSVYVKKVTDVEV